MTNNICDTFRTKCLYWKRVFCRQIYRGLQVSGTHGAGQSDKILQADPVGKLWKTASSVGREKHSCRKTSYNSHELKKKQKKAQKNSYDMTLISTCHTVPSTIYTQLLRNNCIKSRASIIRDVMLLVCSPHSSGQAQALKSLLLFCYSAFYWQLHHAC